MVVHGPLPALPQRHLLTALLELNADLPAVAARSRTPLDELTTWANSADVQAWLDAHRHFAAIAREHRELARTSRNLDHLEELAKATDNPVEKRRILCAIIRGSSAILHGRPTRSRSDSQREGAGGWARATQDREDHQSRNRGSRPSKSEIRNPQSEISASSSPYKSTNPLDILEELEVAEAFLRAHPPATPQNAPASAQSNPSLSALSDLSALPGHSQSPAPARKAHPRSPAHLLAAAGLPAP